MKKFVILYQGSADENGQNMQAWINWFTAIGDKLVDAGNPFGAGKEFTSSGEKELVSEAGRSTGYSIINADSFEEAELLLKGCPMATSVQLFEAMPM